MERSGAAAYHVMWSEEAIRKLMCSQKLRDVRLLSRISSSYLQYLDELAENDSF